MLLTDWDIPFLSFSTKFLQTKKYSKICDDILANMETLLGGFQSDLGSISSEIQVLQDKSLSLSTKLRNRKVVQAELGNFLDELVIPPELVT